MSINIAITDEAVEVAGRTIRVNHTGPEDPDTQDRFGRWWDSGDTDTATRAECLRQGRAVLENTLPMLVAPDPLEYPKMLQVLSQQIEAEFGEDFLPEDTGLATLERIANALIEAGYTKIGTEQ